MTVQRFATTVTVDAEISAPTVEKIRFAITRAAVDALREEGYRDSLPSAETVTYGPTALPGNEGTTDGT